MTIESVRANLWLLENSINVSRQVASDMKQSNDHDQQKHGSASLTATKFIDEQFTSFKAVLEQYLNEEEQKHA